MKQKKEQAPTQARRYNKGKRQWHLVNFKALEPLIEVLEYGAHKYTIYEDDKGNEIKGAEIPIEEAHKYKVKLSGEDNWKNGFNRKTILDCMMRHTAELIDGMNEGDLDLESKKPLIGHILCNAMFFSYFNTVNKKQTENKQKK